MLQQKVNFKNSNNGNITMSAVINFPEGFNENQKYPAIVVGHPTGGVKEQTSGLYAKKMEEKGFVTIAFDASYQGESTGETRGQEDPTIRVGDFHAVVDYLTTLPYVDADRIGGIGICASGGYIIKAAQTDRRIKAVAGISPADIGAVFREGWFGNTPDDVYGMIEKVNAQRTAEANGAEPLMTGWVLDEQNPDMPKEIQDGHEYYRTPRAFHPNSTNRFPFVNFDRILEFSSFDDTLSKLLKQPLFIAAGSEAGTRWLSERAYNKANGEKELLIVEGANHFDLYDKEPFVSEIADKLGNFFGKNL